MIFLLCIIPFWLWSSIHPYDRLIWFLEVTPAAIGIIILLLTFNRFPLSNFVYGLIFIHIIFSLVGGHYTYGKVPIMDTVKELLHFKRNHYDRVCHFFHGAATAIISREIFIRFKI
ncbi:MAG: DUF2238 domain-containing protein, partial [Elusimicrobiota bacterium]